jgi:hypothetical protein
MTITYEKHSALCSLLQVLCSLFFWLSSIFSSLYTYYQELVSKHSLIFKGIVSETREISEVKSNHFSLKGL